MSLSINYMDKTVMKTPKPRACSTDRRPARVRPPVAAELPKYSDGDSLGILNLDDDVDLLPSLEQPRKSQITSKQSVRGAESKLAEERALAERTLNRIGLPAHYMKTQMGTPDTPTSVAGSESTINDSDFLKSMKLPARHPSQPRPRLSVTNYNRQQFSPSPTDISTPRTSGSMFKNDDCNVSALLPNLSAMSHKFRNSDMGIAAICNEFSAMRPSDIGVDSRMFISSADIATQKITADEAEWRKERGELPTVAASHDSINSNLANSTALDDYRCQSMGEFFKVKSQDFSDLFAKRSPEKAMPTPLVDVSTISRCSLGPESPSVTLPHSAMSTTSSDDCVRYSEIYRAISGDTSPSKIASYFVGRCGAEKAGQKGRRSCRPTSQQSVNKYVSAEPVKSCGKKVATSVGNKENAGGNTKDRSDGRADRSTTSVRSVNSRMDCLVDGQLPIETTCCEMVFGCVRIGQSRNYDFVVRSSVSHKIRFLVELNSACFRLTKPDTVLGPTATFIMHPHESRTFTVTFTPNAIGAHSERLYFKPVMGCAGMSENSSGQTKWQLIPISGYGGHGKLEMRQIMWDSTPRYWLSLGSIPASGASIVKEFTLLNTGTLHTFIMMDVTFKHIQLFRDLTIEPLTAVVPPGGRLPVRVTYIPNRPDYKRLNSSGHAGRSGSVMEEIAVIKCLYGEEVIRGIVRVLMKMRPAKCSPLSAETAIQKLIQYLPGECMPHDLQIQNKDFRDKILHYMLQQLETRDVIVTLEQDNDCTIVQQEELDETSQFRTFCTDYSAMTTALAGDDDSSQSFLVEPKSLMISPNYKTQDSVFIMNNGGRTIYFEVQLSSDDLLKVSPTNGEVSPNNTTVLSVQCLPMSQQASQLPMKNVTLRVLLDNIKFDVDIKVIFLNRK